MSTLPIETERLRIRLLTPDDWQDVHAYTSDPGVMTYLPEEVMTEEQTRQFIATSMSEEAQAYAVDLREEDRLIGHIGFHPWYAPVSARSGGSFTHGIRGRGKPPRLPPHCCVTALSHCRSIA